MDIRIDDLTSQKVRRFVKEHLDDLAQYSPPESRHALDVDELREPDITFWTALSEEGELLGCGALKELDRYHGEVKSMRTATSHRREGVATKLLEQIIGEARQRNYKRLSLETGSMDAFAPARSLYARFGFKPCGPFASYVEDPNSVFMTRKLP